MHALGSQSSGVLARAHIQGSKVKTSCVICCDTFDHPIFKMCVCVRVAGKNQVCNLHVVSTR